MKLISRSGRHSVEGKRFQLPKQDAFATNLITEKDTGLIVGLVLFSIAICGWMLNGLTTPQSAVADSSPDKGSRETAVVTTAAPVAEEIEVVTIDQIEALAMGIDAVISSECKGDWVSDTTMIMVANVILNRTIDSRYPDTVDQVLCQPYQFSCFSESGMKWVGKASNDLTWRERCMDAAKAAMNGERMINYGVVYVSGAKQGTVEAQLDGLYFCR